MNARLLKMLFAIAALLLLLAVGAWWSIVQPQQPAPTNSAQPQASMDAGPLTALARWIEPPQSVDTLWINKGNFTDIDLLSIQQGAELPVSRSSFNSMVQSWEADFRKVDGGYKKIHELNAVEAARFGDMTPQPRD